jgi:hypothetical protein
MYPRRLTIHQFTCVFSKDFDNERRLSDLW